MFLFSCRKDSNVFGELELIEEKLSLPNWYFPRARSESGLKLCYRYSHKVSVGDCPNLRNIYVKARERIFSEKQKCLFSEAAALSHVRRMYHQVKSWEALDRGQEVCPLAKTDWRLFRRGWGPQASGHLSGIARPEGLISSVGAHYFWISPWGTEAEAVRVTCQFLRTAFLILFLCNFTFW